MANDTSLYLQRDVYKSFIVFSVHIDSPECRAYLLTHDGVKISYKYFKLKKIKEICDTLGFLIIVSIMDTCFYDVLCIIVTMNTNE